MTHYIFGYGSLMNSSSRRLTGQTGVAIPAVVSGLIRYWGKIDTSLTASPLVVDLGQGKVNGVLLEISATELPQFDTREKGYHRHQLNRQQIDCSHSLSDDDQIWVYIKNEPEPPCHKAPVLQTYIDTVLEGCLEVSDSFARFFVEHTVGWQHPIENDRLQPRYINYAGVEANKLQQIDQLLRDVIPA